MQELPENEKWLKDFWNSFNIKTIKFKNKVKFKTTKFKVEQADKCKAFEIIDNVIQDVKTNYFNNIRKR